MGSESQGDQVQECMVKLELGVDLSRDSIKNMVQTDADYNTSLINILKFTDSTPKFRKGFPQFTVEESKEELYVLETSKYDEIGPVQLLYHISDIESAQILGQSHVQIVRSKVIIYSKISKMENYEVLLEMMNSKLDYIVAKSMLKCPEISYHDLNPVSKDMVHTSHKASTDSLSVTRAPSLAQELNMSDEDVQYEIVEIKGSKSKSKPPAPITLSEDERYELELLKCPEHEHKYLRMAKEGLDRFRNMSQQEDWKEIDVRGDYKLYDLDTDGEIECMMSDGYFEYSVKQVAEYLLRDQVPKQYDDNFESEVVVKQLSMDTKVVHAKFKGVWPVQGRDFCALSKSHWFDDGSFANIVFSIEDDD